VLLVSVPAGGLFNWWHASHHGHMQAGLAVVYAAVPVALALMLSHIGASAGPVLKFFIWAGVVAAMALSAGATAWSVQPAAGLWLAWLFGITVDLASLVALAVLTAGTREPAKAAAKKPPAPQKATAPKPAEKATTPLASEVPGEAERARARYLASVAAGEPLTGRKLAAEFSRSRTWAENRIAEAQKDPGLKVAP
jgi:pyruvate/2-oxoglutarate dehydrogenase complex dihydrolipoamide acyltransferase (E2) component